MIYCKCKPSYNYQSIEFEWDITDEKSKKEMYEFYKECLEFLQEVAPEQPDKVLFKTAKPRQKMASEKQLDYMDHLGIKHPKNCTSAQAQRLLDEFKKTHCDLFEDLQAQ